MSKAEYDQQLELVCNKSLQEREELTNALNREWQEREEQDQLKQFQAESIGKLISLYQGITEEIAEIGLPEGDEKTVEEYVREREDAAAKVQASPLVSHDADFKRSYELEEELGLSTSCGY